MLGRDTFVVESARRASAAESLAPPAGRCATDAAGAVLELIAENGDHVWLSWSAALADGSNITPEPSIGETTVVRVEALGRAGIGGRGPTLLLEDDQGVLLAGEAEGAGSAPAGLVAGGGAGAPSFTSCGTVSELELLAGESHVENGASTTLERGSETLTLTNVGSFEFGHSGSCEDWPEGERRSWIAARLSE